MDNILEFGRIPSAPRVRAIQCFFGDSVTEVMTMPTCDRVLHLDEDTIMEALGLGTDADSRKTLFNIRHHQMDLGTAGGGKLIEAASIVAEKLSPALTVIVMERDLRCDFDTVSELFMSQEIRHVVELARFQTACLIRQLGYQNPELRIIVIDDDGEATNMSIEDALRIPAQQLLPATLL